MVDVTRVTLIGRRPHPPGDRHRATQQEDQVRDTKEDDSRIAHEMQEEMRELLRHRTPPLRLAGVDEDDTWESNVVRGID